MAAPSGLSGPSPVLSELAPERPLYSSSPGAEFRLWPMAALVQGDWSYVRREGDLLELLFNLRKDAGELHNLASDPAMRSTLERMRATLDPMTKGALTPDRFNP